MVEALRRLAGQLDDRAPRERLLLLGVAVAILAMLAELLLFSGLREGFTRVEQQRNEARGGIADTRERIATLETKLARDPNAGVRERIARLERQLAEVDDELQAGTLDLISPEQMVDVLRGLVQREEELSLVAVRSEPARGVLRLGNGTDSGDAADVDTPPVYRHGVTVELTGRFGDALGYLRRLEDSSWRLFWDALRIETANYPTMRIRLRVHTLSLDEGWIGV